MKRLITQLIRPLLSLSLIAVLAACATPSPAPVVESKESKEINSSSAPSIVIQSRSSKAIIEDIIATRTAKGMQIRNRSAQRVEFSLKMVNTSVPTEARMHYVLSQVELGWRLSARVFQISYPGSKKEKVQEITSQVADKLHEELAIYAANSSKR